MIKLTATKNKVETHVKNLETDLGIIISNDIITKKYIENYEKHLMEFYPKWQIKSMIKSLEFDIKQHTQNIVDALFFFRNTLEKDLELKIKEINNVK